MRKFEIRMSTNKIGSDVSTIVEFDDEDVPDDWETSVEFSREMFEILSDTGLFEWNYEEVE